MEKVCQTLLYPADKNSVNILAKSEMIFYIIMVK